MTRRNGSIMKYIIIGIVVIACLYGLYSYHDLHTRLKTADEKVDRLRQQHDSVSAQMQVVYEHKNRLETSLQQEKTDHQRTKDDFKNEQAQQNARHEAEKSELMGRIDSINQENKMLQGQIEDQQNENTKLKEDLSNLQSDVQQKDTQHNEEYLQFKQEKEFEISKLKDDISNAGRKYEDMQAQLNLALHQQTADRAQLQNALAQNNQQQQAQQQQQPLVQQQQQPLVQQQQQPLVQQQQQQAGQNLPVINLQQQNLAGGQPLVNQGNLVDLAADQQHQQNNVLQMNQQQNIGQPLDGNVAVQQPPRDDTMQIAQPGAKNPYYEPKNEGLEHNQPNDQQNNENEAEGGKVVNEQVAPPKFQDDLGRSKKAERSRENSLDLKEKQDIAEEKELKAPGGIEQPRQVAGDGGFNQPDHLDQNPLRAPDGIQSNLAENVADNAKEDGIFESKKHKNFDDDKALEYEDHNNDQVFGGIDHKQDHNDNVNDRPRLVGHGLRGQLAGVGEEKGDDGFNRNHDHEKVVAPQGVQGKDVGGNHQVVEDEDDDLYNNPNKMDIHL